MSQQAISSECFAKKTKVLSSASSQRRMRWCSLSTSALPASPSPQSSAALLRHRPSTALLRHRHPPQLQLANYAPVASPQQRRHPPSAVFASTAAESSTRQIPSVFCCAVLLLLVNQSADVSVVKPAATTSGTDGQVRGDVRIGWCKRASEAHLASC